MPNDLNLSVYRSALAIRKLSSSDYNTSTQLRPTMTTTNKVEFSDVTAPYVMELIKELIN